MTRKLYKTELMNCFLKVYKPTFRGRFIFLHFFKGVNLSILGRLVRGERKIENLTIKTGYLLTEYADQLQKKN